MNKNDWLSNYKEYDPFECKMPEFKKIKDDCFLITAGDEKKCNSMTINWASFGIFLQKPTLTVYVGAERYTKEFIDKSEYFTVSALDFNKYKDAIMFIGSYSGKFGDKYKKTGLTPIKIGETMTVKESHTIYLCRRLAQSTIIPNTIRECEELHLMYDVKNPNDYSVVYIAEIIKVYKKNK